MKSQSKNNVSSLKPKDEKLRQAVQGFKLLNLKCNYAEISRIVGIDESTAHNKKEEIEGYWDEASTTLDNGIKFIRERSIELSIESVSKGKSTLGDMLGVILGIYLKAETDLLDKAASLKKTWTIGQYIANIHESVCSYKTNEDGVPVHSIKNKYARYLLQAKNMSTVKLDELFTRTPDYTINEQAKKWQSTELLKKYVELCIKELLKNLNKFPDISPSSSCVLSSPHMFLQKGGTSTRRHDNVNTTLNNIYNSDTKNHWLKININNIYTMLIAKKSVIEQFEQSSLFCLLKQSVKATKDAIYVPIKHRAKASEYLGRTYNVFCSIRSEERKKLGYIGYDMSAALQSICLQLINAKKEDYPILLEYANNKEYKKQIRAEIAEALDIDVDEVKSQLTAYANGSKKDIGRHEHYRAFQTESNKLRKAVLRYVSLYDKDVLINARLQSRKWNALKKEIDWTDTETIETWKEMQAKSSVFFFVWTYYERHIRQAMLEHYFEDGIEVHDAVYSKIDIDPKLLKKAICDWTEFNITIEQEK